MALAPFLAVTVVVQGGGGRAAQQMEEAVGGAGYGGWAAYAGAEFGVSRSTAYRLLDLAAAAEAIEATVRREAGPELSHAWDTGLVLPMRAVVDLKGRIAELTDLIAERLADAGTEDGQPPEAAVVAEIVARSVDGVGCLRVGGEQHAAAVGGDDLGDRDQVHDGGDLVDLVEPVDRHAAQQLLGGFGVQALGVAGVAVAGPQRGSRLWLRWPAARWCHYLKPPPERATE
ncbi:hypothetical protein ACFY4B_36985 [Kitasatospora sp. NPDC001261]|uniref:hypothetical protein n=1 Tax=Kitasatospora sp. NPDC001261 TaxID=3364012 RepID=UPI0036CF8EE0